MPTQPRLPFGGEPPEPKNHVFFAVQPPADVAGHCVGLTRTLLVELGLTGKPLAAGRLHVSLQQVGEFADVPREVIAAARDAAAAVAMPPFAVALGRLASFGGKPGRQPLVLYDDDGVAGLALLHQALGAAMASAGFGPGPRQYTPHMTLAYGGRLAGEHTIEPVRWTVSEFILTLSEIGAGRHTPLARFPLRG
jgi:2'-5' RNA ligase